MSTTNAQLIAKIKKCKKRVFVDATTEHDFWRVAIVKSEFTKRLEQLDPNSMADFELIKDVESKLVLVTQYSDPDSTPAAKISSGPVKVSPSIPTAQGEPIPASGEL